MCIYANAFVAGKQEDSLILPEHPEGLLATLDGVKNAMFSDAFTSKKGEILTFHDGHCLCQFSDWKIFFEYADRIRQANDVDMLPVMISWTGVEYAQQQPQEIDLELDDLTIAPEKGVIMYVGISIRRRLARYVGSDVSILFKNGKTVTGFLKDYQSDGEYGEVLVKNESVFFNVNEIRHVDAIV